MYDKCSSDKKVNLNSFFNALKILNYTVVRLLSAFLQIVGFVGVIDHNPRENNS